MNQRPGTALLGRPLHFLVLADCSGSMTADGKIQALNHALRETLPHLSEVAAANPHANVLVRAVAFGSGAWWHIEAPTPVADLVWEDLMPAGYTDLGAALRLIAEQMRVPPMDERALPPAIVLISDGMPTDDYRAGLQEFLDEPWGARSVRVAVGIGRDADHRALQEFMGTDSGLTPMTANNPEQLVRLIRWASTHASRAASNLAVSMQAPSVPQAQEAASEEGGDVW